MRPWRQRGRNPYQTAQWRALRREVLRRRPACRMCGKRAKVVDHIRPHRGDLRLFFDLANLQPLCWTCHQSTKARDEINPNRGVTADGLPRDPSHLWGKA